MSCTVPSCTARYPNPPRRPVAEQPDRLGIGDHAALGRAEKLQESASVEQLVFERVVGPIVELLQYPNFGYQDREYSGRPGLIRDGRGKSKSILSVSEEKSTCVLRATSGLPSFERRFPFFFGKQAGLGHHCWAGSPFRSTSEFYRKFAPQTRRSPRG